MRPSSLLQLGCRLAFSVQKGSLEAGEREWWRGRSVAFSFGAVMSAEWNANCLPLAWGGGGGAQLPPPLSSSFGTTGTEEEEDPTFCTTTTVVREVPNKFIPSSFPSSGKEQKCSLPSGNMYGKKKQKSRRRLKIHGHCSTPPEEGAGRGGGRGGGFRPKVILPKLPRRSLRGGRRLAAASAASTA